LNGVAQQGASWPGQIASTGNQMSMGVIQSGAVTGDLYFDDVLISVNQYDYPMKPGKVLDYAPSGAATHVTPGNFDWSINNGGTFTVGPNGGSLSGETVPTVMGSAGYLDDWPVTTGGAADLVRQAAFSGTDYLAYDVANTAETNNPWAVRGIVAHRDPAVTGNNTTQFIAASGANTTTLSTGDPNAGTANTYLYYHTATMATAPGSVAWTPTNFNSLQLRLDSTLLTAHVWTDALLTEVAFPY
jgi:hypothetical protein